jgi:hypothetical protein
MPTPPEQSDSSRRRYHEEEISEILKRTAELQRIRNRAGEHTHGLTLEEIQEIAREAGLDPSLVHTAAAQLETPTTSGQKFHFWGAPLKIHEGRIVQGDLTDELMNRLILEMRAVSGKKGRFEKLGKTLTWSSDLHGAVEVTVRQQDENIHIQGQGKFGTMVFLFYYLPLFLGLVLGGGYLAERVSLPGPVEGAILVTALLMLFMVIRPLYALWNDRQERSLGTLMDHLEAAVAEAEAAEGAPAGSRNPEAEPGEADRLEVPDETAYEEPRPSRRRSAGGKPRQR